MKKLILFYFIISISILSFGQKAKVTSNNDGDTFRARMNGQEIKVRLYGIDCPEIDQEFGKEARKLTGDLIYKKTVRIEKIDVDKYGRIVALVYIDTLCLNEELIKNGLAWVYDYYCKKDFCSKWKAEQDQAKNKHLGLWQNQSSIPPWEYRRMKY